LANGNVAQTLQYNTDVLRGGPGIRLNKNTPNQVRVDLVTQQYNLMIPFDENSVQISVSNPLDLNVVSPKAYAELLPFTNMLRLDTVNDPNGDLLIYIDDTDTQWSLGQTVRLTFNNNVNLTSRNVRIFTDAPSRLNTGAYGKTIANITGSELSTRPIIELICTEQGILNFVYDIIK
jgi:hypothetical protein